MHSPLCDGTIKMEVFTGPQSHMFLTLINTLFTSQALLSPKNLFPADFGPNLKDGDEFDFIVVGSGSAGSTVAYRLSEHQNWTVLLLEAGGYPSTATEIPLVFFDLAKTQDDWHYDLEPSNSACLGSRKQKCMYPRGKTLGGTSAINGMMYIHGHRKDFDTWEDKGNVGWGYDSMIKHIKKVEDVQVENMLFGKGGELKITQYRSPHPIRRALIRAYQEVGYGEYDQENPIGYFDSFTSIYKGTRVSAAKAFLSKAKNRKNLYVALNAQVGRVLLEGAHVTGVEVRLNDQILKIKSRKEVILSAGSINSPQILMNSGIGPKDHLRQLGIPVVKDLEVGQNLQDHIGFTGLFYNVADHALLPKTSDSVLDDWYQYFRHRTGPISQSGIQNFLSFLDTTRKSNYPTSEMYYIPLHKNDVYGGLKTYQRAFNLPDDGDTNTKRK
ncbi:hypothetical protein RI129_012605 [Pyrocoelia pectoralis]|uniref:Glucose-methanol-choline oxidoreductase N-terminal domain-containing protein n=1 Tax=Pyrocoelia pectoralis TaxID=417401 RepID=A0AAN7UTT3_9COLE